MQAPRYVEDNANMLKYRMHCYNDHKEKLKKIQGASAFEKSVARQTEGIEYYNTLKGKNKNFHENERNTNMNRTNQILLNKLVDISHGKRSSVNGPTHTAVVKQKRTSVSQAPGPRSLNISVRKKENDRIERENHAFAKRLFENSGSIPQVHHLERQFDQNRQLKQRVMRVKKTLPGLVLGKRATALPPLDASKSELQAMAQRSAADGMSNSKSKGGLGQSPTESKLINQTSEHEIVIEQAEPSADEKEEANEKQEVQDLQNSEEKRHEEEYAVVTRKLSEHQQA